MKQKKVWIPAVMAVISVVIWLVNRGEDPAEKYETQLVERKDLAQTVSVTGEIKAKEELALNFEKGGRVKSILAQVGEEVARGEVLAAIEDENLSQQVTKAKAALDRALAQAGTTDDMIREQEEMVENARDYREETEKLEDQKVEAAEVAYQSAKDYYEDAKDYYDQVVSDSGADSSEAKYAKLSASRAESEKKAAEEALSTTRKMRDLAVLSAENQKDEAEERLETAHSQFARRSDNAAVASARADYEIALNELEKASLKAPVNGKITEINYQAGEVLGMTSGNGSMGPLGRMIAFDLVLEANVPEADIVKVKLKQRAEVLFDSLDESEVFEAEVIEIEPAATTIQDVVYYQVKFKLSQWDGRIKPGMSADIDIQVAQKDQVLSVPYQAVEREEGRETVEILTDQGGVEARTVKTGLRGDDGEVEILEGLREGERIIVLKNED